MGHLSSTINRLVAGVSDVEESRLNRMIGAGMALPTGLVLGLAMWLTPSEKGYGTHLQLGLKECTVMHFTGWPCPMCGMTTTFTLMAHARPLDALHTQPFGVVLFVMTFLGAVVGMVDLLSGMGLWRRALALIAPWERPIAAGLMFGLLSGWLYKAYLLHPTVFAIF
ncbi:MAG TPA: DUF2752 domain-containing protein [Myxococcota bacterium]|nr:DUF2752 domain-containing protein [Myxococcota bacterium]